MISDNITLMIMEATKNRDTTRASVYKLIKNEFLKHNTAKNTTPLTESIEISIIQKMIKQREESIDIYKNANREDLWTNEQKEIDILRTLVPKIPTEADINDWISTHYPNGIDKKDMGLVIKSIKNDLVGSDGKMVADVVKSNLI